MERCSYLMYVSPFGLTNTILGHSLLPAGLLFHFGGDIFDYSGSGSPAYRTAQIQNEVKTCAVNFCCL